MQTSQIRERFSSLGQSVYDAANICQLSNDVPEELRDCLSELDQEYDQARQVVESSSNDQQITQCVDRLEKLGDRAMQACKQAGNNVDPELQRAVTRAHDSISQLKHQLH